MLKLSGCDRITNHLSLFFIFITTLSIILLSQVPSTSAVESSATATVHVSEACSLTSTILSPHNDSMGNGTYTDSLGSTKFTVKCNDASGFALYAIGYSGDEYGATSMLGDNELSIPTGTDASAGNTTSHWSMKISKDTTSYLPSSLTIENSFGSQHLIPSTYTKIASFPSSTDGINGTGSSILATYGVRISGTQAAGTYIGKVKYTLVHPNMVDDSNKPVYPLTENDCPAGYVCYAPNTSDIEGSMASISNETIAASDKAGKINVGQSVSATPTLIAPNYKRSGYGFAGWSTEYNYTSTSTSLIYGPNQTITVDLSGSGLILYPVWVASTGNLQNWNGCSSLTAATYNTSNHTITADLSSVTALTDTRDGNVYAVARLTDGLCWMIENLRLDDSATLTIANTNNPIHDANNDVILNANGTTATHLAASNNSWCTSSSAACIDQTMLNTNNTRLSDSSLTASYNGDNATSKWYGYGNYYNWYSATAGNGTYSFTNSSVTGNLCPTGWHLPYGGSLTSTGSGNTAGGFYYLNTLMSNNTDTQGSKDWRTFPSNFVYSGYWSGNKKTASSTYGDYWSSRATASNDTAFDLILSSSYVRPGTYYNDSRYRGHSVRCVISLPTISDVTYFQDFVNLGAVEKTSVINSMTAGTSYSLTDKRDGKSYNVAKLADGKVWMRENLAIDLTTLTQAQLYGIDSDAGKMTNASNESLGYLKGTTTGTSSNKWPTAAVSKTWTSSSENYFSVPMIAVDSTTSGGCSNAACVDDPSSGLWSYNSVTPATINNMSSLIQGKLGVYYNYCAASAGSYCYGNGTSNTGSPSSDPNTSTLQDVTEDICPAGWRLPTGYTDGEYQALYETYSSSSPSQVEAFETALSTPLVGQFDSGNAKYQGVWSVFWTSTWATNNNMRAMYVDSTSVHATDGSNRRNGYSVRCTLNS